MLGTDGIVPLKMSTVPTAIAAKLEVFDYRLVDARAPPKIRDLVVERGEALRWSAPHGAQSSRAPLGLH
jgi:hypothetical protein